MEYISKENLLEKKCTIGIHDALNNDYGSAEVIFVDDIEKIETKKSERIDPKCPFSGKICEGDYSNYCDHCGIKLIRANEKITSRVRCIDCVYRSDIRDDSGLWRCTKYNSSMGDHAIYETFCFDGKERN